MRDSHKFVPDHEHPDECALCGTKLQVPEDAPIEGDTFLTWPADGRTARALAVGSREW